MAVTPISGALAPVASPAPATPITRPTPDKAFGATLQDVLGQVEGTANDANQAVARMLDGSGDIHEALIALQRADMTLQMTVAVRNKLIQAYQDIMRMSV